MKGNKGRRKGRKGTRKEMDKEGMKIMQRHKNNVDMVRSTLNLLCKQIIGVSVLKVVIEG